MIVKTKWCVWSFALAALSFDGCDRTQPTGSNANAAGNAQDIISVMPILNAPMAGVKHLQADKKSKPETKSSAAN